MDETTLLAIAVGSWTVACIAIGMWYGERGRRIDVQRVKLGRVPGQKPKPAQTITPQVADEPPPAELAEPPTRFVDQLRADTGCSEEEAAAEWRRLLAASQGDRTGA